MYIYIYIQQGLEAKYNPSKLNQAFINKIYTFRAINCNFLLLNTV